MYSIPIQCAVMNLGCHAHLEISFSVRRLDSMDIDSSCFLIKWLETDVTWFIVCCHEDHLAFPFVKDGLVKEEYDDAFVNGKITTRCFQ